MSGASFATILLVWRRPPSLGAFFPFRLPDNKAFTSSIQTFTMPKYSIAQTLPAELLELVFEAIIDLDKKEARARVDHKRQFYGPPARKVGISLEPVEKRFLGSSRGVLPRLTVCKSWYP